MPKYLIQASYSAERLKGLQKGKAFRLLCALIVLGHDRRRVIHFDVIQHPTQVWLSRQMTGAFPWDTASDSCPL